MAGQLEEEHVFQEIREVNQDIERETRSSQDILRNIQAILNPIEECAMPALLQSTMSSSEYWQSAATVSPVLGVGKESEGEIYSDAQETTEEDSHEVPDRSLEQPLAPRGGDEPDLLDGQDCAETLALSGLRLMDTESQGRKDAGGEVGVTTDSPPTVDELVREGESGQGSEGKIWTEAGDKIFTEAGDKISTEAGDKISTEAGGKISTEAGGKISTEAGGKTSTEYVKTMPEEVGTEAGGDTLELLQRSLEQPLISRGGYNLDFLDIPGSVEAITPGGADTEEKLTRKVERAEEVHSAPAEFPTQDMERGDANVKKVSSMILETVEDEDTPEAEGQVQEVLQRSFGQIPNPKGGYSMDLLDSMEAVNPAGAFKEEKLTDVQVLTAPVESSNKDMQHENVNVMEAPPKEIEIEEQEGTPKDEGHTNQVLQCSFEQPLRSRGGYNLDFLDSLDSLEAINPAGASTGTGEDITKNVASDKEVPRAPVESSAIVKEHGNLNINQASQEVLEIEEDEGTPKKEGQIHEVLQRSFEQPLRSRGGYNLDFLDSLDAAAESLTPITAVMKEELTGKVQIKDDSQTALASRPPSNNLESDKVNMVRHTKKLVANTEEQETFAEVASQATTEDKKPQTSRKTGASGKPWLKTKWTRRMPEQLTPLVSRSGMVEDAETSPPVLDLQAPRPVVKEEQLLERQPGAGQDSGDLFRPVLEEQPVVTPRAATKKSLKRVPSTVSFKDTTEEIPDMRDFTSASFPLGEGLATGLGCSLTPHQGRKRLGVAGEGQEARRDMWPTGREVRAGKEVQGAGSLLPDFGGPSITHLSLLGEAMLLDKDKVVMLVPAQTLKGIPYKEPHYELKYV